MEMPPDDRRAVRPAHAPVGMVPRCARLKPETGVRDRFDSGRPNPRHQLPGHVAVEPRVLQTDLRVVVAVAPVAFHPDMDRSDTGRNQLAHFPIGVETGKGDERGIGEMVVDGQPTPRNAIGSCHNVYTPGTDCLRERGQSVYGSGDDYGLRAEWTTSSTD